jgi:UDP-N-acetylglucosamine--N-acetylmuramyl-(pentapeptide) pyrophosphoryl-undecaprenol N-acetylglucosamine transferase
MNFSWQQRCVVIVAGGTGGHVFPALAIAQALREQGANVQWIGTSKGIEARVVPANDFPLTCVDVQGLRQKGWKRLLLAPWQLLLAVKQVFLLLRLWRADLVLGMGGYAAGPVGVAAWLTRTPLVIHEQNAEPGLTNRLLARIAARVLLGFPNRLQQLATAKRVVQVTGNPLRAQLLQAAQQPRVPAEGRAWRLLVVGGSLGAAALNECLPQALALLPESQRPEVRHQTGEKAVPATEQAYQAAGVAAQVCAFIEDMAAAYHWADMVVARAGALTVSELAVMGRACILVPYPFAVDDHQTKNAEYLVKVGAAELIPQAQLTPQALAACLNPLSSAIQLWWQRGDCARLAAYPHATDDICGALQQVLS